MTRRYWPAALAILAVIVFGSFLVYTQFLLNQLREQDRVHSRMFAEVQRGLLSIEEGSQSAALLELQGQLKELNVPLVLMSPGDTVAGVVNLPFDAEAASPRVKRYANQLKSRGRFIETQFGTIYYGSPRIVRYLTWIPYLQTAAGILLVLTAFAIIRANVRSERERMWAAMARELAHQMGTPLSSLTGWMEVLQLPAEEREAFGDDQRIGNVMSADVERLERVSRRFELIGKPPALQPVRIGTVLSELEDYFRPRLPRLGAGIDLRMRAGADIPAIEANAVLLVWALENIVKNAIDALAGKGGRILISAKAVGDLIQIQIADDGPGIAPEVRGRIFEPGVTTKSAGWGVGLSLTQRIIEDLHGGRITVHERKRGGTIFEVLIPAQGQQLKRRLFSFR